MVDKSEGTKSDPPIIVREAKFRDENDPQAGIIITNRQIHLDRENPVFTNLPAKQREQIFFNGHMALRTDEFQMIWEAVKASEAIQTVDLTEKAIKATKQANAYPHKFGVIRGGKA